MTKLKNSLTRKLGPLPIWAWAIITGVAIYVYRSRQALVSGAGTPASTDANSPTVTDQTGGGGGGGQDPVTLQPGESVYDPNTGQLVGGAPEQLGMPDQPPITLEPGESAFDPNTGQVVGPDGQPQTGAAGTNVAPKRATSKHRAKHKRGHTQRKSVRPHSHGKHKPRSVVKLVSGARKMKSHRRASSPHPTAPKGRTRGKVSTHPTVPRARAAPAPAVSLRQRPAAPRVTSPSTQRVETHPARVAATRSRPAPAPRRRRK